MPRSLAIACAVLLVGACGETHLRRVPCSNTHACQGTDVCVEGLCAPCGEACRAGEDRIEDAGVVVGPDAGIPEEDAGFAEEDAGLPKEDAGFDAGPMDPPDAGELPNIDPICGSPDAGTVFPPVMSLPQTVPASCLTGFEMNNFKSVWSTPSLSPAGAHALRLEVDIATYQAPDVIRILGTVNGVQRDLLLTCRLQTSDYGDPTGGRRRPPEDAIREFRLNLPEGTTLLTFDFTASTTPTYIRVLGLCDFDLQPPPNMGQKWRLISGR